MVKLLKNTANDCFFTLNEKTTLSGATYLLAIYSNQKRNTKVLRLSGDSSTDTIRYNKFVITEVPFASENLNAGDVYLEPGGYDYFAYQTTGSTLSITADTTTIVESGKLICVGTGETTSTFVDPKTEWIFE